MAKLEKRDKESVALLFTGTFLEYLDLMLYVHMAVVLNDIFFPTSDPHTAGLISAAAFCSTYLFRPIGAWIFGHIGDKFGRRVTVIITTFLMAFTCVAMASLPTYGQIGFSASIIVTICRIVQGISSMGEITGAQLYISETIPAPRKYPAVASLGVAASAGSMGALGIAYFVTNYDFNWRIAFWMGAMIALVGGTARTKLRETPEFADVKLFLERGFGEENIDKNPAYKKYFDIKAPRKTVFSLLFMDCMWPLCFYFSYIYCGLLLKNKFGYSPEQVIQQNLLVSIAQLAEASAFAWVCAKIHPLKILKWQYIIFIPIVLSIPYFLGVMDSPIQLLFIQAAVVFFAPDAAPATSVFFKHFPILKRFKSLAIIYAVSRAVIYLITSLGFVYFVDWAGNIGVLFLMVPICIGFGFGWLHFNKLESIPPKYIILEETGSLKIKKKVARTA